MWARVCASLQESCRGEWKGNLWPPLYTFTSFHLGGARVIKYKKTPWVSCSIKWPCGGWDQLPSLSPPLSLLPSFPPFLSLSSLSFPFSWSPLSILSWGSSSLWFHRAGLRLLGLNNLPVSAFWVAGPVLILCLAELPGLVCYSIRLYREFTWTSLHMLRGNVC